MKNVQLWVTIELYNHVGSYENAWLCRQHQNMHSRASNNEKHVVVEMDVGFSPGKGSVSAFLRWYFKQKWKLLNSFLRCHEACYTLLCMPEYRCQGILWWYALGFDKVNIVISKDIYRDISQDTILKFFDGDKYQLN